MANQKTEGDAVRDTLLAEHASRNTPGPKVSLPNGARVSATPYIGMSYQGMDATVMLGDPNSILREPRPGHKYVWKKRNDRQTAAWVRSGILRPVEPEEVDSANPMAEYVEDVTATGKFVTWESLTLFEMPPKWVKKIYQAPEDWAIARIAQQQEGFAANVEATTAGKYKGKTEVTSK